MADTPSFIHLVPHSATGGFSSKHIPLWLPLAQSHCSYPRKSVSVKLSIMSYCVHFVCSLFLDSLAETIPYQTILSALVSATSLTILY